VTGKSGGIGMAWREVFMKDFRAICGRGLSGRLLCAGVIALGGIGFLSTQAQAGAMGTQWHMIPVQYGPPQLSSNSGFGMNLQQVTNFTNGLNQVSNLFGSLGSAGANVGANGATLSSSSGGNTYDAEVPRADAFNNTRIGNGNAQVQKIQDWVCNNSGSFLNNPGCGGTALTEAMNFPSLNTDQSLLSSLLAAVNTTVNLQNNFTNFGNNLTNSANNIVNNFNGFTTTLSDLGASTGANNTTNSNTFGATNTFTNSTNNTVANTVNSTVNNTVNSTVSTITTPITTTISTVTTPITTTINNFGKGKGKGMTGP
jgi:hypothetical protein